MFDPNLIGFIEQKRVIQEQARVIQAQAEEITQLKTTYKNCAMKSPD